MTGIPHHPLASLFPLLEGDEFDALVADIRAYGLRQQIVLYNGAILDGRNRYRACIEAGIEPRFEAYNGSDPLALVVSLNLARRHLSESQRAMVAAKIATLKDGQRSDLVQGLPIGRAAEMLNVGERSVARAKSVLDEGVPELIDKIERGDVSVSAGAELARLPELEQRDIVAAGAVVEAARDIFTNGVGQFRSTMPKFTGDFEWYTPVEYIELAVEVMGAIDCDPASCADANKVVGAEVFYSQDDDGLKQKWHGRTLAIQTLMRSCRAICFPEGRIKFYNTTEPERANGAGHGQAIFYFGENASKFRRVFGRKGEIVLPWRNDILSLIGSVESMPDFGAEVGAEVGGSA